MNDLSTLTKFLAQVCVQCVVCRRARKNPTGWANALVRYMESRMCPACRAYEKVFGRKAYESDPRMETDNSD